MGAIAATVFGIFGRYGRFTGVACLLAGLAAGAGALGVIFDLFDVPRSVPLLVRLVSACVFFLMLALGFLVANPWKRDPRFVPLKVEALLAGLPSMQMPFFVCLDCKLLLPFEVAVGRCPRCESASACLEVASAADLQMVKNALGPDEA